MIVGGFYSEVVIIAQSPLRLLLLVSATRLPGRRREGEEEFSNHCKERGEARAYPVGDAGADLQSGRKSHKEEEERSLIGKASERFNSKNHRPHRIPVVIWWCALSGKGEKADGRPLSGSQSLS